MVLIIVLLTIFVWIGLTAREFDGRARYRMVALIVAAVATDYALLGR